MALRAKTGARGTTSNCFLRESPRKILEFGRMYLGSPQVVVSKIFFHRYLGKSCNLINIFQMG